MKRKTFKLVDDERILIYEEEYDSAGNIIYLKDYQAEPIFEKYFSFNSKNALISETEIEDNEESYRTTFEYDDNGDVVKQNQFISGELYEETVTTKERNGFRSVTFQEGIETELMTRVYSGNNKYKDTLHINGEVVEFQIYEYDTEQNKATTTIHGENQAIVAIRSEIFDNEGKSIDYQELNGNGNLIESIKTEYRGDLIIKELHKNYAEAAFEHHLFYTYDSNGNLTKKEVKSSSDNLLEFYYSEYNSQNRVIAEKGFSLGHFDAIYGKYFNHEEYNITHEYE